MSAGPGWTLFFLIPSLVVGLMAGWLFARWQARPSPGSICRYCNTVHRRTITP